MKKTLALILALCTLMTAAACSKGGDTVIDVGSQFPTAEDVANTVVEGVETLPDDLLTEDELFEMMDVMYPALEALINTLERGGFESYDKTDAGLIWLTLMSFVQRDGGEGVTLADGVCTVEGESLRYLLDVCFAGAALPAIPEGLPIAYDADADSYIFTVGDTEYITTDILNIVQTEDGYYMDVALLGTPDEREFVNSYRVWLIDSDGSYPYCIDTAFSHCTDIVSVKEVRDTDSGYIFVVDYQDYELYDIRDYTPGDTAQRAAHHAMLDPDEEAVELLLSQYATVDGTGLSVLLGDAALSDATGGVCEAPDAEYLLTNCTRLTAGGEPVYLMIKAYNSEIYDISLLKDWYAD